jgi:hypothetical protein
VAVGEVGGVWGVDVAAEAQRPVAVEAGFGAVTGVSGEVFLGVKQEDVGNPLFVGGVKLGLGSGQPAGRERVKVLAQG